MTPSVSLNQEVSAWVASARIQAVGSLLGIPVDGLLAEVAAAEDPRRPHRRLSTTLDFERVALLVQSRGDEALVEVSASGREGQLAIEHHAFRRAGLGADLALLRRIAAMPTADWDRFDDLAGRLSPDDISAGVSARHDAAGGRRVTLHVPVVDLGALLDGANALGVTSPQRGLVSRLHPILAPAGRKALAALHLAAGAAPDLTVTYRALSHEALIRIMAGLHPGPGPAGRIGKIAAACGAAASPPIHWKLS